MEESNVESWFKMGEARGDVMPENELVMPVLQSHKCYLIVTFFILCSY